MFDTIADKVKNFGKFNKTKKLVSQELLYSFYNIVSKEIQQGIKDEGVWAKSFADAQGDEQKAKAIYIDLMVERLILKHEAKIELEKEAEIENQKTVSKQESSARHTSYSEPERKAKRDESRKQQVEFKQGTLVAEKIVVKRKNQENVSSETKKKNKRNMGMLNQRIKS